MYQYTHHIFGAKDLPVCANYALQRTTRDNNSHYPEATKAVLENFYMDDYLDSVESPERALKRSKELVHLLQSGTFSTVTQSLTQRLVLSLVSKVFEPISLVGPFTVGARLLLKDIWRVSAQHWDEELPKVTVEGFLEWSVELPKLSEITIPRRYFSGNFEHLELHMFGDSSLEVFSALALLRVQVSNSNGPRTELTFVLGKARVAPMKVMTIPKL